MAINKLPEFAKDGQKNTDDLVLTDGFPVSKKPARQWFNYLFNMLSLKINELIDLDPISKTEIIDNLTTDDATKPLSAKQAKVLQDTKLGKTENAASATKLQTARTIGGVSFDGSANINLPGVNTAGNQSTTGNAATATSAAKWTTARTLTIGDSGKSVDGGGNVSWSRLDMGVPRTTTTTNVGIDNAESCIGHVSNTLFGASEGALYSHVYSEIWKHQIQGDYRTGQIALRGKNDGTWQAWRTVLDSGNYNNYSPTKTGTGASGSWGISITGNAASATDCSRSVIAGNGLSGGGTLETNQTLTLGTPSKITGSTTNSVTATSHTHEIDNASTSVAGVVKLNNTLTSASTAEALTAAQGKVLNDQAFGVGQSWQNVTSQRISGTTYTNTTGKPIVVSIHIRDHPQTTAQTITIVCSSITLVKDSIFESGGQWGDFSYSFIVPDGKNYSYTRTGSGEITVAELR